MIAVVQRVSSAAVSVDGRKVSRIGPGAVVLLGVDRTDHPDTAERLADRIARLRYFDDADGRLNNAIAAGSGSFLVVSQFTLCADCRKGTRPSYVRAAPTEQGRALYEAFVDQLRAGGNTVETGVFGARMKVSIENDGPVTLIVEA